MTYLKLTTAVVVLCFSISSLTYSQWFQQNSGTTSQLLSVCFVNQYTGIACGSLGKVLRTTNGGINWNSSTIIDTIATYHSIYFTSQNTGFIAGDNFYVDTMFHGASPKIIKTTNAGITWVPVLQDTNYTLQSIYFINDLTGYAGGGLYSNGPNELLKTTNGGINWVVSTIGNGYLYFITFVDVNTGFASAWAGGYLYKTTNAGLNWTPTMTISIFGFCLRFFDANTGYVSGGIPVGSDSSGTIRKTTDGGNNWSTVFTDNRDVINSMIFVNQTTGFAAGSFDTYRQLNIPSRIIKTTNSGNNWFIDTAFSSIYGISSLFFTDALTGFVVGGNGVILKTTTGGNPLGVEQVGTTVPVKYNLSQNYPNPFNPNTKIEFALPKTAMTRIVVYDDLGRLVAVVIDQELKAGTYKVDWDATGYPSGVYFYKLTAEDFSQTKKMVLIK